LQKRREREVTGSNPVRRSMIEKHEVVLKYVGVGPHHASFTNLGSEELPFGQTSYYDIPLPIWHGMDNPHLLTLTVVVGDQLNG